MWSWARSRCRSGRSTRCGGNRRCGCRCRCRSRRWPGTRQRIDIRTPTACPNREGRATPVNLRVPYHRVRQAVLEPLPRRGCHGYVIGKINAPVGAGKDLLRLIWVNDDRVHRNVREIAGLVRPGERAAIGCACYLVHVTRCCGRVSVEAANSRVPDRQTGGRHCWIERDTQHRAIW
jgi:hypothetical protein